MDCEKIREPMFEDPDSAEVLEHVKSCPECRKTHELMTRAVGVLKQKDNVTEAVMKKVKKAERMKRLSLITKIAAVAVFVLMAGIFAKIAIDNGLEKTEKSVSEDRFSKAESSYPTTNGTYGAVDDAASDYDAAFEPEAPMEEPMSPSPSDPEEETASDGLCDMERVEAESPSVLEDDTNMLLNQYKSMNSLPMHTADIVVSGDNIQYAKEMLEDLSPSTEDSHIVINGDFYFEAQRVLENAGFDIILTTSAETIKKTLVYFDSLIK